MLPLPVHTKLLSLLQPILRLTFLHKLVATLHRQLCRLPSPLAQSSLGLPSLAAPLWLSSTFVTMSTHTGNETTLIHMDIANRS
jgi:hypothetical protein